MKTDKETRRQGDKETGKSSLRLPQSFPDPRPALYQWLATRPRRDDAIDRMRRLAWPALAYRNQPALSPEVARQLFPSPLRVTAAQLETQAACPFRHFLRYGVRLAGREAHDVTAMDMSHVFHEVLEILVAELIDKGRDWSDLPADEAEKLVREYAAAVAQQLRGEVMLSTARNKYLLQRIERTLGQVIASLREMLARGRFRPAHAGVSFGDESGKLPAYPLRTPGGAEVRVSGKIDRIDVAAEDGALAVFDYKLGDNQLSVGNLYHGLSLQLMTYLLVLEASGEQLIGKPLTPAAAFYLQLLRGLQNVDHPDDALNPTDPLFHLRHKPRGVFDGRFLKALDSQVESGASSDVVNAHLKQDGQFGYRDRSDAADAQEFSTLLGFVRTRLGQIADEVIAGRIDVAPYRIGRTTPCPRCEYRPVCRFEPAVDGYRHLTPLKRSDALDRMTGQKGGGDAE
jgi:ATP-dependent helicase/nuclease subunit B